MNQHGSPRMPNEPPRTFAEVLSRAQDTIDHRSKSFVDDALSYARWILADGKAAVESLVATSSLLMTFQNRCAELAEENAELRAKLGTDHK